MNNNGTSCKFEFTNVKCTSLEKNFCDFEYCYLKSVNRSYKFISLKVNLFKTPRFNGYRPFMFNVTVDACRFLNGAKAAPVVDYMYGFFRTHSNMNHTCPFDHDIILEKLDANFMNDQVTKVLPVPEGDYLVETHWIAYDIDRVVVKIFCTIS
ncbi:uncharacterized protein Dana_GF27739 [Drosophila ananassae]|uniref:MD-2-related lipid-recognition domain-containing protein n=1 Tax=Drosophila ananassae TaxID=7217 RepID=A0A0N8NYZ1_DROAN|nr:uncharacterized protein LOC26515148 [Drosophila ananassae]KPU72868.1 uncharacterized protein Dana_GF27739 [Drosophila ananassae]